MPQLGFKGRFASQVEAGMCDAAGKPRPRHLRRIRAKRQTLRPPRKREWKRGDTAYAFYGLRTKQCRRLGEAPVRSVTRVCIFPNGLLARRDSSGGWVYYSILHARKIARDDGFRTLDDMVSFFRAEYGLPVELELIRW